MTHEDPHRPQTSPSPNGLFSVRTEWAGEIRFGPNYYSLLVDGLPLPGARYFDGGGIWSADSRYFAIQEWLSTSEREGPRTRLVVIRFPELDQLATGPCDGGWTRPLRFEGGSLVFARERSGLLTEFDIDPGASEAWTALSTGRGTNPR